MRRSQSLPAHALRLSTYTELQRYAAAFAEGHLNLLMLFGPPGVGKSRCLRQALTEPACWFGGQTTAFGIFCEAYQHRHRPLIFDDIDGLHTDRTAVRLLKALCQTERQKTLCWLTDAASLDSRGIPRRFVTTSRVALIGNQWRTLNPDVAALEDRGHVLLFDPSPQDVHRQAADWFWDQEVFDLIADHLHLLVPPSLRTYLHAWELKRAGLDWRRGVLSRCLQGPALEVARLKADPVFASEAARVRAFVQSGAGCRATYFRHAKKLQPTVAVPKLRLVQAVPPAEMKEEADHLDRLRRRFGELGQG